MIAALFVEAKGVYAELSGVDPWDEARDARLYAGPHPVVAHPPCQRWGNFWYGCPSRAPRFQLGDDGGCFASALASVRQWGGVFKHPALSRAWASFGLMAPPRSGGWVWAGDGIGWTCHVEQGHYAHPCPKATWLYAVGVDLPSLRWGVSRAPGRVEAQWSDARNATPIPFRDLLLSIARTAKGYQP